MTSNQLVTLTFFSIGSFAVSGLVGYHLCYGNEEINIDKVETVDIWKYNITFWQRKNSLAFYWMIVQKENLHPKTLVLTNFKTTVGLIQSQTRNFAVLDIL